MEMMTIKEESSETREDMERIFKLFDHDNSRSITIENLKRIAQELKDDISEFELQEMIERADSDGDGNVTFEDFYQVMTKRNFL